MLIESSVSGTVTGTLKSFRKVHLGDLFAFLMTDPSRLTRLVTVVSGPSQEITIIRRVSVRIIFLFISGVWISP
jgi:hypothetical protein